MNTLDLPEHFIRTIVELNAEQGHAWLDGLPTLLARYARQWSITLLPAFGNLSYNYVAPALGADGAPLVFKAGVPNRELAGEIAALRLYDGRGAARLLQADAEQGVMLLERLLPGTTLDLLEHDDDATSAAAEVMRSLWRPLPPDHPFPSVEDWAAGLGRLRQAFDGGGGPFPPRLVAMAETLFAELIASAAPPMLLHGDLHHQNIITAQRAPWLAIDPKGLAGEPAYEVGALLRNRLEGAPSLARLLDRRIALLAERLELDSQRLRSWSLAQAVLSAWWSYEDHGHGWEQAIAVAEALDC